MQSTACILCSSWHLDKLSENEKMHFRSITEALTGANLEKQYNGLQNLAEDPNISLYLPALNEFIANGVYVNIQQGNMGMLITFMKIIRALLRNQGVNLRYYLSSLTLLVKKCILENKLCLNPQLENHWELRDISARLIAEICWRYNDLRNSITKINIQHFSAIIFNCNFEYLPSIYGALHALADIGHVNIRNIIIPNLKNNIGPILKVFLDNGLDYMECSESFIACTNIKLLLLKIVPAQLELLRDPPDYRIDYVNAYGYLGPELCDRVLKIRLHLLDFDAPTRRHGFSSMLTKIPD